MSITKLDAWVVYEDGETYTPPTSVELVPRRLIVLAACAEHNASGTHTLANGITLGGVAATFIARRSGFVEGTTRLGVNVFAIPEASILISGGQAIAVDWDQAGAVNTFLFIATLEGVNQTTWTDDTAVGYGNTGSSQYPSWTLDTNTADGLGVTFVIGSNSSNTWSFTTQDGWSERLDVANSSTSRAYLADKVLTGASTTAAITSLSQVWTRVSVAFKPHVDAGGSNIPLLAAAQALARNQ